MSAEQVTGNKALFSRFHEAINSGDAEEIAKTIDELVAPDVLFHTPAPIDATGVQALKQPRQRRCPPPIRRFARRLDGHRRPPPAGDTRPPHQPLIRRGIRLSRAPFEG
ncbi:hypothetical protein [Nonomuraea sp. NPDC049709]|uniref:hypothetical protein n=1 Tax=Nonomuraea sp. NPDC049709 TaxID=3154736 RepID=UPI00341437FA